MSDKCPVNTIRYIYDQKQHFSVIVYSPDIDILGMGRHVDC